MTKRRLFRWLLILITLAVFTVWLEPTRVLWGWLRGEAFYQGRPTSYWRDAISRWEKCGMSSLNWQEESFDTWYFCYRASDFEKWLERFRELEWPAFPAVLAADPPAHAVLNELKDNSDAHVCQIARERLRGRRMNFVRIRGGVGP